jgi:hypothetical protein
MHWQHSGRDERGFVLSLCGCSENRRRPLTRRALILAAILVAFVAGNAMRNEAQNAPAIPQRYAIYFSPLMRADTFLLDAQTGQVWCRTLEKSKTDEAVEV